MPSTVLPVAPGANRPPVDLSADRSWPARSGRTGRRPGGTAGAGEPPLGLPEDRRGVPQPRRSGVGDLGTTDPASPPDRTRTLAGRAELDAVLHAQASGLLPRTSSRSRPSGWPGCTCCSLSRSNGVQCTWWSVGVPASPQPADGPRGTGAPIPVPDARPRREVQRRVRRGVHHIRHRRR